MKITHIISAILVIYIFVKRAELVATWARLKFQRGEMDKALKTFEKADKIGTLKADSLLTYGYILLRTGNIAEARTVLTRASMSAAKPKLKKRIKMMLALVEWKDGSISQAIEMLEEVIVDFKSTAVYQDLGLLYILEGNKERALEFNLEAYDYNDDDMVIMDNLAEAYALCGETEKSAEMYEKLLEKNPHFPEAYYGYGLLLIKMGERERGIELVRESLSKRFSFLSVKTKEEVEALLEDIEKNE